MAAVIAVILALNVYLDYRIDTLVHNTLYSYGLRFSLEWANPYWTLMRTNMIFTALASGLAAYMTITTLRTPELPVQCPFLKQAGQPIAQPTKSKGATIPTIKITPIKKEKNPEKGLLKIIQKLEETK